MFFDAVLATRVIHHTLVGNIKRIVSEIDRVLKNGGYVFLQVPEYEDHERVLREARSTHSVLEPGTHVPLEALKRASPPLLHKGRTAGPLSKLRASRNPCKHRSLPRFLLSGGEECTISRILDGELVSSHRCRLERNSKGRKKKESRLAGQCLNVGRELATISRAAMTSRGYSFPRPLSFLSALRASRLATT